MPAFKIAFEDFSRLLKHGQGRPEVYKPWIEIQLSHTPPKLAHVLTFKEARLIAIGEVLTWNSI